MFGLMVVFFQLSELPIVHKTPNNNMAVSPSRAPLLMFNEVIIFADIMDTSCLSRCSPV